MVNVIIQYDGNVRVQYEHDLVPYAHCPVDTNSKKSTRVYLRE